MIRLLPVRPVALRHRGGGPGGSSAQTEDSPAHGSDDEGQLAVAQVGERLERRFHVLVQFHWSCVSAALAPASEELEPT